MNVLLLGSGGREDALAWRLRQSPSCDKLLAAPGNPGIARWAECVALDPCDHRGSDRSRRERARRSGRRSGPRRRWSPASPTLCATTGFAVFGPNAAAAQLEGSKGFTKDLCAANDIPTAGYVRVGHGRRGERRARAIRHSRRDQGRRARRRQGRDRRHDAARKPRRAIDAARRRRRW